jgi:hypothetical protein
MTVVLNMHNYIVFPFENVHLQMKIYIYSVVSYQVRYQKSSMYSSGILILVFFRATNLWW